jgi:hypothetical protein
MQLHPSRRLVLSQCALAAVALMCACTVESPTTPAFRRDLRPAFGVSGSQGQLHFCKSGPPGTYTFHITASDGTLPAGSTFQVTIAGDKDFACVDGDFIWLASSATGVTTITVSEDVPPGIAEVDWLVKINDGFGTPAASQVGGNSFTFVLCNDQNYTLNVTDVPTTPPPPTGKTFSIGPSSMEGHLTIHAGDFFNGGYSFKFKSGSHAATQYSVTARVEVPVTCPAGGGAGGTIVIDLGTRVYNVPANNTDWLPTGDANSILSWQGSTVTPDLCGGFPMDNARGAIYTATVSQSPPTGSLVDFRFKYRDPAAKGKPNTDCTNAADPNRNRADVCGASWSQTVTDP